MAGITYGLELGEDFLAHPEFLEIGAEGADDLVYDSPVYLGLLFIPRVFRFVSPTARIRSNRSVRTRAGHRRQQRKVVWAIGSIRGPTISMLGRDIPSKAD
jgi:hypothetical protein